MRRFKTRLIYICCLVLAISLIPAGAVLADDDDGTNEVGVFWVSDYTWPLSDLPNSDDGTGGFIGVLDDYYTSRFNQGDDNVEDDDFEDGGDADTVDICFYQGHGDPGTLIFGDDLGLGFDRVSWGSCNWGDTDLEWIMLHACQTLEDDTGGEKSDGQFAHSLNGIRLICGADTSLLNYASDGAAVANRLVDSDGGGPDIAQTVKESWFLGIDQTHGAGRTLRVIAEGSLWGNDYIWGQGTGPNSYSYSVDDYYYSWAWNCS